MSQGESPRALLRRYGIHPQKRLGQNFLIDPNALDKVANAAGLGPDDAVLEIGAGLGTLTERLLARAGEVVAVEIDPDLIQVLEDRFQDEGRLRILAGDILEVDPGTLFGRPYNVVGNIPYYITGAILRHLLEASPRPSHLVLTVQKEVAEQIIAPAKQGILSISVHVYGRPELAGTIPRQAFYPMPQVDSAILRMTVFPQPAVDAEDIALFFRVVKAGFSAPRKQLRNTLSHGLRLPADQVTRILEEAGVDARRRAETLSLHEWEVIYRALREQLA